MNGKKSDLLDVQSRIAQSSNRTFRWERNGIFGGVSVVKCKKNDGVALREVIDEKALNWCYECDISDP